MVSRLPNGDVSRSNCKQQGAKNWIAMFSVVYNVSDFHAFKYMAP